MRTEPDFGSTAHRVSGAAAVDAERMWRAVAAASAAAAAEP